MKTIIIATVAFAALSSSMAMARPFHHHHHHHPVCSFFHHHRVCR